MTEHTPRHAVVIASGGLDSTAVAYLLASQGAGVSLLSFDYGQRHRRELTSAAWLAERLGARHDVVNLQDLGRVLRGSALTDASVAVPDGAYTPESLRSTVVPNRNAILLNVAAAVAVAEGADAVAFGAHAGDHTLYPDCRPEFFRQLDACVRVGNDGLLREGFQMLAPFLQATKVDIVATAARLGVPFELTWSCYKGGETHCGACSTCTERREAFRQAGIEDPTLYAPEVAE